MNKTFKKGLVVLGAVAVVFDASTKTGNAIDVSAAYGINTNKLTSEHGSKLEFKDMTMHGVNIGFGMPVDLGILKRIEAGFGYDTSLGDGNLTENNLTNFSTKNTVWHDISAKAMRYDLALIGPRTGIFDHMLVLSGDRFNITKADHCDFRVDVGGVITEGSLNNQPKYKYNMKNFDLGYSLGTGHRIGSVNLSAQTLIAFGCALAKGDGIKQLELESFDEKSTYMRLGLGAEAEMDLGTVSPFLGAKAEFRKSLTGSYKQNDISGAIETVLYDKDQKFSRLNAGIYAGGRARF